MSDTETDPRPALVVIDVQRGFDAPALGERNNPDAERRVAELLDAWRAAGAPLVHVRHESASPDGLLYGPASEFKPEAVPLAGEDVVVKHVNSAFIGTDLERRLRARGVTDLVMAGLTTDHCCSTTARMAANLGFRTYVVGDAMATFARRAPDGERLDPELVHRVALASLDGEFAEVIDTAAAVQLPGR